MGHYSVRDVYLPHELFNRIDQEYMCREHIQCTIIRVLLFVPHVYMCKCSVCVCVCVCVYVCGFVYTVDRLHDLSGETESVYANAVKQPGLVRVKA